MPDLDVATLLRLQNWLSPAFPVGAYSFSHGLESAIAEAAVRDARSAEEWIVDVLRHGSLRNDAILLCASHRAVRCGEERGERGGTAKALSDINQLALALSAGAERRRETLDMGAAFERAAACWDGLDGEPPMRPDPLSTLGAERALPIVVGALSARHALPIEAVVAGALQTAVGNLAWIATRLVPLGQSETLRMLARLEPLVAEEAHRVTRATLDDIGGCAFAADIASLRHEHLESRVCLT